MLVPLNLPSAPLQLTKSAGTIYVFCLLRKKKIKLTPEEWVRQHIIHYLIQYKKYPVSLMQIEQGISLNKLVRRCDLIIYNRQAEPQIIVECKAPTVPINQLTLDQASQYNYALKASLIFLTNGLQHAAFSVDYKNNKIDTLTDLPDFSE
jgi:hypothetical protein